MGAEDESGYTGDELTKLEELIQEDTVLRTQVKALLVSKGAELAHTLPPSAPDTPENRVTRERGNREGHYLSEITFRIIRQDRMDHRDADVLSAMTEDKKLLMAQMTIDNLSKEWLEATDDVLYGDPLDLAGRAEDARYIEQALKLLNTHRRVPHRETFSVIEEMLGEHISLMDLSHETRDRRKQLAAIFTVRIVQADPLSDTLVADIEGEVNQIAHEEGIPEDSAYNISRYMLSIIAQKSHHPD